MISTLSKCVAREDDRDFLFARVTTNDGPVAIDQGFFFAGDSLSFAAKR